MVDVDPLRDIKTFGAAVAQSTREEILQGNADWASPALGEIVIIEKLGLFGAVTCTIGMYKGRKAITEEGSALDATTFGNDWEKVATFPIVLRGGEKLKLFMTDSAANPAGVTCAVLGKVISR